MTQQKLIEERRMRDEVLNKMAHDAEAERKEIREGRNIDRGLINWWG